MATVRRHQDQADLRRVETAKLVKGGLPQREIARRVRTTGNSRRLYGLAGKQAGETVPSGGYDGATSIKRSGWFVGGHRPTSQVEKTWFR